MSAQLPDRFLFEGREYDVISSAPPTLFDPTQWGLAPVSPHEACLRGTIATFTLKEERLCLKDLRYWSRTLPPTRLREVKATKEAHSAACPEYLYEGINALIPWSGQLVLGRAFLWPLLLPRGFQPAWKYKEVVQLLLEEGNLRAFGDVSKKIARLRADVMETVQAVGW
jgi:hypothetical protein